MASEENFEEQPVSEPEAAPATPPAPAPTSAPETQPAASANEPAPEGTEAKQPSKKGAGKTNGKDRKHDKLVKKANRTKKIQKDANERDEPCKKLSKKVGKGEEEESKKLRLLAAADYREEKKAFRSSATRKRQIRLNPVKPKRKAKLGDLKSDLREETIEEKGHRKELIYTVFHDMEIEVNAAGKVITKEPVSMPAQDETECRLFGKGGLGTAKQSGITIRREREPVLKLKYDKFEDVSQKVLRKFKGVSDALFGVFQIYQPTDVMLAFNGGKDSTAVLHMLNNFYQANECLKHIKIPTLYINEFDAFEEVEEFVDDCAKLYNIELIKKPGPAKRALAEMCMQRPSMRAVFMGCKRSDPHCSTMQIMQPTDVGWPSLMRISPIIDWSSRDVWEYLYMYNVPYCSLYAKGYTSIGTKNDTIPNPYLGITDNTTGMIVDYRPGHELLDNDELERAGRKVDRTAVDIAMENAARAARAAERKARAEAAELEKQKAEAEAAEQPKEPGENDEEQSKKKKKGGKPSKKKK